MRNAGQFPNQTIQLLADKEGVDISAIALQGLEQAESQFALAASQLSSAGIAPSAGAGDTVDLSEAAVALISAKDDYASNVATMKIADDMVRETISLLA